MSPVPGIPEMKPRKFRKVLRSLGYEFVRKRGSHEVWAHPEYRQLVLSYHDGATISPRVVKKMLVKDGGVPLVQALEACRGA